MTPGPDHTTPTVWEALRERFAESCLAERLGPFRVIVAVSGGADSVALLRLLVDTWSASPASQPSSIVVAHFNHALRGAESDQDQQFVEELAARLGLECVSETAVSPIHKPTEAHELNVRELRPPPRDLPFAEEPLRQARYRFLRSCLAQQGARCLLTAHTADDQVETLLHHLFRGTGPSGLCGIPARRSLDDDFLVLRPLLGFRRQSLRQGLREIGQAWREDSSNQHLSYSRNWIRRVLLPLIRERYPLADEAILRLIATQTDWHAALRTEARTWIESHVRVQPPAVEIVRGRIEPAVLGIAIGILWDRMGWPRQRLGASHHRNLWLVVCSKNRSARDSGDTIVTPFGNSTDLPGGLRVRVTMENKVRIAPAQRSRDQEMANEPR